MDISTRSLLLALLVCGGCIDLGSIKITITDDTGFDTGGDPAPDSTPPDLDDSGDTEDSAPVDDSGDTGRPVHEAPTTFTGPPLGDDVFVYQGDGALPVDSGPYLIDGIEEITEIYNSLGADVVVSDTWPDDPSPYKLVFWYLPGAAEADGYAIPETTVEDMLDWLGRGGRLVIAGDVDTEYMGYSLTRGNETIDAFLEEVGVNIRVEETIDDPTTCEGVSDHALMQNGATVESYLGNSLQIAGDADWLYCDGIAMQDLWCGEVIVSGDVNPVSDNPGLAPEFVQNLYQVPVESPCEYE